jgi:hypothetical protein
MTPKLLKELQTTANKRRPVDAWFWELFVQACGTKCCACGKTAAKLERGHIVRHADGGQDSLNNLLPVCLSCNKKYLKKQTPDIRPTDWRERFFLLLGYTLRPQISVSQSKSLCNLIPATKATENSTVITWQRPDFAACTEVFTQSGVTYEMAESLVRKLVKKSKQNAIPPKPPYEKRQVVMRQHAMRHGEKAFEIAGDQFLWERPWVIDEQRGMTQQDSWQHFCESFDLYLEEGRERAKRNVELAKAAEAKRLEWEQHNRESRYEIYLLAADAFATTQEDREFVATADTEKAAGVIRDVTEEELQRSRNVCHRGVQHWRRTAFLRMDGWYKTTRDHRIAELIHKVRDAKDIPTMSRYQDEALSIYSDCAASATATSALESSLAEGIDERSNDSEIPF